MRGAKITYNITDIENMNFIKCSEMRCGTAPDLITSVDLSTDFACKENVSYDQLKYSVNRSFRMDAGAFILCTRGSAVITLNMYKYVVKDNDLIVFLPHNFIKINEISPDTLISFISFSSDIIRDIDFLKTFYQSITAFYSSSVFSLTTSMASFFRQSFSLWSNLHKIPEIAMDRNMIKDAIYTSFHTILCLSKQDVNTIKTLKETTPQIGHHLVQLFIRLSMQYYPSEHSISFYAGKMNISVANLCHSIKKRTGKTPLEIISHFIIIDAQTQLKTTERSVKDIANSLGFSNATSFCRFFRKNQQISPLEYRNDIDKGPACHIKY